MALSAVLGSLIGFERERQSWAAGLRTQVVSGIGFLGAGAILLRGKIVCGLTTAAILWTVAAIRLSVGGGLYVASVASTAIILIILAGIKPIEERYRDRKLTFELTVRVERGEFTIGRSVPC